MLTANIIIIEKLKIFLDDEKYLGKKVKWI